ncbi:PAAR domain-containing protein [Achromobacter animicus]
MMTARPIIRVGDKTTHGGTVLEGFSSYDIDGRAAAGLGHKAMSVWRSDSPQMN